MGAIQETSATEPAEGVPTVRTPGYSNPSNGTSIPFHKEFAIPWTDMLRELDAIAAATKMPPRRSIIACAFNSLCY
jgi:hypothetical protein